MRKIKQAIKIFSQGLVKLESVLLWCYQQKIQNLMFKIFREFSERVIFEIFRNYENQHLQSHF